MEDVTLVKGAIELIQDINLNRGLMWDKISMFSDQFKTVEGVVEHKAGTPQSKEMSDIFPLKQTLEGGLYTRELFMPEGSLVVSMIHKQQHPSFLLSGKVSYLTDSGEVETIVGPTTIFTQIGTQRVLYIHEDTKWVCVYKTDAETFEEAEADVYTNDYKDLPLELITRKNKILCQD
tara:strand:+ start:835 stop:1365 length:531 start_codon:yes stop_codon:yes gene_type:complete